MRRRGILVPLAVLSILTASCLEDNKIEQPTFEERLAEEQAEIDAYLRDNNITALIEEANGLRHIINEQGTGDFPVDSDTITVRFEGRLFDDTVFDSSDSITLVLNQLIVGWRIGLPLIQEGGSITMYIPSVYAWDFLGSGDGSVPPGANVIFDVGLMEIR